MTKTLTEKHLVSLACHLNKDETRARQLISGDEEWNALCAELLRRGLLIWEKTYEHTGQTPGWGIISKTEVWTRILSDYGRRVLKEKNDGLPVT